MGIERLSASLNLNGPFQKRYKDTVLSVDRAALLGVVIELVPELPLPGWQSKDIVLSFATLEFISGH